MCKELEIFKQQLRAKKAAIQQSLPSHIDVAHFQRVLTNAVEHDKELLNADRQTLFNACLTSAQLGLVTDRFLGECYLLAYNKKGSNLKQVQVQIGYRGLLKLARQSGDISNISAHVVYERDDFEYVLGDNETLKHIPSLEENRGDMLFVYAIAKFKDGSIQRAILTKADVIKRRKASKTGGHIWNEWEEEMWKKTALRALCKLLPMNTNLQNALEVSNQTDAGNTVKIVNDVIVTEDEESETKKAKHDILSEAAQEIDITNTGENK